MLKLEINTEDLFDEDTNRFLSSEPVVLELEHSLVSLSRWESKWERPFLDGKEKTNEEAFSYISCMSLRGEIAPEVLAKLSEDDMNLISKYIEAKMTATKLPDKKSVGARETITAELIYYWMIQLNIPWEAQDWHLERLLTLIKVCNFKNAPKKKLSHAEMAAQRRALNDQRRAQFNTNG